MKDKKIEKKVKSRKDVEQLRDELRMKYEIADELGLLDKVFETGWGSLSAQETGRIGGLAKNRRQKNL